MYDKGRMYQYVQPVWWMYGTVLVSAVKFHIIQVHKHWTTQIVQNSPDFRNYKDSSTKLSSRPVTGILILGVCLNNIPFSFLENVPHCWLRLVFSMGKSNTTGIIQILNVFRPKLQIPVVQGWMKVLNVPLQNKGAHPDYISLHLSLGKIFLVFCPRKKRQIHSCNIHS